MIAISSSASITPQLVADSEIVNQIDQRLARGDLIAQSVELGMLARVQAEDRAGVDLERGQQPQAVFLGGGKSFLVRHDSSAIEFLEPHARDISGAMQQPPLDVESLRVMKDRGTRRPLEDARREPFRERFFRRAIAIRLARRVRAARRCTDCARTADSDAQRRSDRTAAPRRAPDRRRPRGCTSARETARFVCRVRSFQRPARDLIF